MQFKIRCLFKCPALPLPLVQIRDPRALPNVKFPAPGKGLLSIARGLPGGGDVEGSNWSMHKMFCFNF